MSKEQKVTGKIQPLNKDLEILKQNFPNCFDKSGNLDFEKFKKQLSKTEIKFSKESYGMDWLGKSYARLLASDAATTLLKEDEKFNSRPENKNSENLLIKGDNLEVLKHLSNAYYEKIKMIYIDPPYNTGGDGFVYEDDRKFDVPTLMELAGISEERAKRILDFTQSKSNSHSAWLTFMYPRLYIAKQLLREDGVIFVSIDDNEVAQLSLLMDEVFGEENFIENFSWVNNQRGRSTDKFISNTYENILMYAKNIDKSVIYDELEENDKKLAKYNLKDEISFYKKGDNLFNNNSSFNIETRPNLTYSIYVNKNTNDWICVDEKYTNDQGEIILTEENKKGKDFIKVIPPIRNTNNKRGCWRWSIDKFNLEAKKELMLEKKRDGTYMFYTKSRLNSEGKKYNKSKNLIQGITSVSGTNEVVNLFNDKIFSSPKPTSLLVKLLKIGSCQNDLILDFFAGSGTTADAVMQLNTEDASTGSAQVGDRKFILVQLPEPIDPKKNKTAYDFVKNELKVADPTIFEITKERLIRAGKKIKKEQEEKANLLTQKKNLDLGFKVFETMPIWENYHFEADELDNQSSLLNKNELNKEDIKALLVTWKTYDSVPLTQPLQAIDLTGYTAHYGNGKLYLMDKGFKTEYLKALLEKIDSDKEFNPTSIIAFGYHFESKHLREISENVKSYANKKNIDIDFITRY